MADDRTIYCCTCATDVRPRLTDGREIYPHRPDLAELPFWRCVTCRNYVGCHHKTKDRTNPLGVIPNAEMRNARKHIHARLDPIWKEQRMDRRHLYARLTKVLGRQYHTAELRTIDEARMIFAAITAIERGLSECPV